MRLRSPARGVFDALRTPVAADQREREVGRRVLDGLHGSVEVLTDDHGVAHIFAESSSDLFFAQGYVTARDRLFQMDFNRHAAAGRMAELVGRRPLPWRDLTVHLKERTTVDADVMLRTFGLARVARASLRMHSRAAREVLAAYAAGVNAFVATGARSLEHRALRLRPAPWREVDSLVVVRTMAFELNLAWRAVLLGAQLGEADLPDDIVRFLCPGVTSGPAIIGTAEVARDLDLTHHAAAAALGFGGAAGVGSNSFAVAGSHTRDGDALLANDIHLTLTAPLPVHEIHLVGDGLDLHGFVMPGVPGIAIGRSASLSWGITAGLVHDLDLFVERLHPRDPSRYLTPDGWHSLREWPEVFRVRGEGEHVRRIAESRHGPLLETAVAEAPAGMRYAVAWTGHRPGREIDNLLGMWRARDFGEFEAALRHHVCPTYNLVVASAEGRVGYILAGAIPRRRQGTPLRPLEGWTGAWDWDGEIPWEDHPRLFDPESGFVVTANNRPAPATYPWELGGLFEPPHRFVRISQRLAGLGDAVTREDLAAIQLDDYSAWGVGVRDALLEVVGGVDGLATWGAERAAAELWCGWDGHTSSDSDGAAVAMLTALTTGPELVRRLAGEDAAFAWAELGAFSGEALLSLPAYASRFGELGVDVADVVRTSFAATVRECTRIFGDEDVSSWRWGDLHPICCRHRFHGTLLGTFFDIGPEPAAGGPDTVNRGDVGVASTRLKVGPAMRLVASARDRDRAGTIVPGGQSGDRFSSHYDDQLGDFLAGRLKATPVSRERISVAARECWLPRGPAG